MMNRPNKLGEKAFLFIVSSALAELGVRNSAELDEVLSGLKLHTHNLQYWLPETEKGAFSEAERLYATLVKEIEFISAKYASMTSEEWNEGIVRRQFRKDLFDSLD